MEDMDEQGEARSGSEDVNDATEEFEEGSSEP